MRSIFIAVVRRPGLWFEALRAAAALARRDWWRRPPFLPLPDRSYLQWRVATAYGDPAGPVAADDVVAYLDWRRRQHGRRPFGEGR